MKIKMQQKYADRIPFITEQVKAGKSVTEAKNAAQEKFGVMLEDGKFSKVYYAIKADKLEIDLDSRQSSPTKGKKLAKVKKAARQVAKAKSAKTYKHVTKHTGSKLKPVLFGKRVEELKQFCKDNNCVLEVNPAGWRMAEMLPVEA